MENYLMLNGKKIELSEEQVRVLTEEEKEKKKSPFDRVEKGESYYEAGSGGYVFQGIEDRLAIDNDRHATANYCTDEMLMRKFACYDELHRLLRRFSYENGGGNELWDGENYHYFISHDTDGFWVDRENCNQSLELTYFPTEQITIRAIKEIVDPYIKQHKEFFPGIEVE